MHQEMELLSWFLLFIGAGWLIYKYRRTDINQNEEESSSGLSPFAVFSIIVVILVVFVIIMAAVLYAWVVPLPGYPKSSPIGSMIVFEGDGVWNVQIIKMNPQQSINSVHWYLMDIQGLTKDEGRVTDIYGYKQGEGKSIIFIDKDYNAKVSPGDIFTFYPGEGESNSSYSLADVPSLNDYSFRLIFDPTFDTIGSDVYFTS